MVDSAPDQAAGFLGRVAAATLVVIAIAAGAGLLYYLVDILLLLFLGIIVSATLQPWHVKLCTWGVPRGLAIVLIYVLFLGAFVTVAVLVAPIVIEEITAFADQAPQAYSDLRDHLAGSHAVLFRIVGRRLPGYETLIASMVAVSPTFFQSVVHITASIITTLAYIVTVFALGIYWTIELPRVERLLVSLLPVGRRARTLTIWHEIESKLGGFMRGQLLVMLSVGVIAAAGYAIIGLPNVLVLGVLAALFESIPLVGPVLAAVPALLVALPLGTPTVLTVIAYAMVVQLLESNVLVPRIMHGAVGTSALIGLFAVLAFGTLYGIMGVFIAIPMAAVLQVIIDRVVINGESELQPATASAPQIEALMARVRHLRQQARTRLRGRESRMGIDPDTADHVVDAADQRIEEAVEQVQSIIAATHVQLARLTPESQASLVEHLEGITAQLESALDELPKVEEPAPSTAPADPVEASDAAERIEHAVGRVREVLAIAQDAAATEDAPREASARVRAATPRRSVG